MGVISFALKGNYKRFYNDLKELSKITHKPAWYMFLDTAVCTYIDLGISVQSMLLQAVEIGLNGLCILSFDKQGITDALGLGLEPLMVLAIGKSVEKVRLVDIKEGDDHSYYRENGVHCVPKVVVDDLLIE